MVSILIYLGITLIKIRPERDRLRQALCKYESLTCREETEKQLDSNIQLKRNELQELDVQQAAIRTSIKKLQAKLRELEAKEYLISIDDYEPKYYYFVNSGDCLQGLKDIELEQERMRDTNQAFICDTKWSIGEGKKGKNRGKQMTKDILKMIEFAFEKQCKYAKKEVSYNNVDKFKKQINDSFNIINKYLQKIECRISEQYLNLKLRELDLQYELEEIKQEEKERERAIQEQMKQEKKERFKIEKAQQEAEEAEQRERQYQEEIERIRRLEETNVSGLHKEDYENQIKDLEKQLAQAKTAKEKSKEKVILYSEKLKSGYIYVISNIGSLGRDVYRIFMTKNNNPDAYIRTMNPYLPFPFDVHYKIFSDNASETVKQLHQKFNDRRVNIENERREFFKVSFNEIEQVVQEIDIDTETVTLTIQKCERVPQAYEYRRTKAAEPKNSYDTTLIDGYIDEDEIA